MMTSRFVRFVTVCCIVALAGLVAGACFWEDENDRTPTPDTTPAPTTPTVLPSPATPVPPTPTPVPGPAVRAVSVDGATSVRLGVGGAPSWSPDSSRIAVASREEGIVVVDVPSGDRKVMRAGPCQWADWAPVGGRIAVNCGGKVEIVTTAGTPVSEYGVSGHLHGWSPDGERFAVSAWRAPLTVYDGSRWFSLDTDTQWFRWLDDGGLAVVSQPSERGPATVRVLGATAGFPILLERQTRPGALPLSTSVSPDGKVAAYGLGDPDSGTGNRRDGTVILMDLTTGVEIAVFTASAADYPGAPLEFAPDSTNVLVQTDVCKAWNLAVAGVDGTLRQVASGGFWVVTYSPDGKQIGFTRGTELWIVPSDGTEPPRRLATGVHGPAGFEWSPNGKWLAVPDFFGGFGACE